MQTTWSPNFCSVWGHLKCRNTDLLLSLETPIPSPSTGVFFLASHHQNLDQSWSQFHRLPLQLSCSLQPSPCRVSVLLLFILNQRSPFLISQGRDASASFFPFLLLKWTWDILFFFLFKCLFGCTRSQLQRAGSLRFTVACCIFSGGVQRFSCGLWNRVPQPGIKPRPPLGGWSLSHWTTREVPGPGTLSEGTCLALLPSCQGVGFLAVFSSSYSAIVTPDSTAMGIITVSQATYVENKDLC